MGSCVSSIGTLTLDFAAALVDGVFADAVGVTTAGGTTAIFSTATGVALSAAAIDGSVATALSRFEHALNVMAVASTIITLVNEVGFRRIACSRW